MLLSECKGKVFDYLRGQSSVFLDTITLKELRSMLLANHFNKQESDSAVSLAPVVVDDEEHDLELVLKRFLREWVLEFMTTSSSNEKTGKREPDEYDDESEKKVKVKGDSKVDEDEDYKLALKLDQEGRMRQTRGGGKVSTSSEKTKKTTRKKASSGGSGGGLMKPVLLSPALIEFFNEPGLVEMPRTGVVKKLWAYFKEHDLQDPKDRRFILCDERLKRLFQVDRISSFSMNKNLSKHLKSKSDIVDDEEQSGVSKRKSSTESSNGNGSTSIKVLNFSSKMQNFISACNDNNNTVPVSTRPQLVKLLWAYIKQHNLQDPSNKRIILFDDRLRELFGTSKSDMFAINRLLSEHCYYEERSGVEKSSDDVVIKREDDDNSDEDESDTSDDDSDDDNVNSSDDPSKRMKLESSTIETPM